MLRLSSLSAWIKIGWYEQKESVGTYLLPVPRFEAFALPSTVERATPIQRQISCNIQNDKKMCVNANIYSI